VCRNKFRVARRLVKRCFVAEGGFRRQPRARAGGKEKEPGGEREWSMLYVDASGKTET